MNSRRIAILVVAVVAAVAIGGIVASQLVLRGDDVPELGLDTPAPSAAASSTPGVSPAASAPAAATNAPSTAAGDLAGTWTVTEGEAGYRVRETFLQQQADVDAVGRTSGVTGSLTVDGAPGALVIASGSIVVDMTTLESDESRRDNQLRGRGLETDTYPTSTFEIRGPVALPAELGSADVAVTLPGTLTLHGVTQDVEIAAQARVEADGTVVVAGSLPILFADYDIEAPSIAGLIAVQDNGVMEFRVVLARG
ncbi:MAG: YceI family protein [Chloroflexi bacterium]|jgi:polyisoprenoid-binding protein YceI|nr:YceI family protein [Chloroflexota bacterium]